MDKIHVDELVSFDELCRLWNIPCEDVVEKLLYHGVEPLVIKAKDHEGLCSCRTLKLLKSSHYDKIFFEKEFLEFIGKIEQKKPASSMYPRKASEKDWERTSEAIVWLTIHYMQDFDAGKIKKLPPKDTGLEDMKELIRKEFGQDSYLHKKAYRKLRSQLRKYFDSKKNR